MIRGVGLLIVVLATGCTQSSTTPVTIRTSPTVQEHDHTHEREKMLLADVGPHHAALTAHLSKVGNELDIFIETAGREPKPFAIEQANIIAKGKRVGDPMEYVLTFDPAPAEERPKNEPKGKCSHFVAKAAWLTRDDVLELICEIEIDGKKHLVKWSEFVPRKFAYHDDALREPPAP